MIYGTMCVRWLVMAAVVTLACSLPASARRSNSKLRTVQKKHKYRRLRIKPGEPLQHELVKNPGRISDDTLAKGFLSQYGYFRQGGVPLNLQLAQPGGADYRPERDADSEAIRMFQRYFGLKQTGQLDQATLKLMKKPRCGVADIPEEVGEDAPSDIRLDSQSPSAFRLLDSKWDHTRLSWKLEIPTNQLHRSVQRDAIRDAFNIWRQVAPLEFREETRRQEKVDINILFGGRQHGDTYPFDGPGVVLAHAFGPGDYDLAGDMHIDNDETWGLGQQGEDREATDLLMVATHELGHSLGLAHSLDPGAIMYPYYTGANQLGQDDIKAIQSLYGARIGQPRTTQRPVVTRRPATRSPVTRSPYTTRHPYTKSAASTEPPQTTPTSGCDVQFDVVIKDDHSNRDIYTGIQGDQLYRFRHSGVLPGFPATLHSVYPGAPLNADSVFTVPEKSATYFVKGNQVWRYKGSELDTDYPKRLERSHFPETIRFVLPLVDTSGHRRIFVFGTTFWLEYNFDTLPSYRPTLHVIPQYWPAVTRDVSYGVEGHEGYIYLISPNSHVVLDKFRQTLHGGKREGHPQWMQPACRLAQTSSGTFSFPSLWPTLFASTMAALFLIHRKC
ncbi:stromelysin-1-like [Littorina saxatilis]|uniref:Peptidase metallopeptidase domain-containing protein n=1 Tax=Littorina saxatilis TaxID=31220 RepID=A0AAN9FWT2_9CAEN